MIIIDFIISKFKKKINSSSIKKILIIRNDHIGDLCLTLPLAAMIKQIDNKITVEFLISEYSYGVAEGNKYIDKIHIQKKDESSEDIIKRLSVYDAVINACSTRFNAELCGKINAGVKIAFAYKFYNLKNFTHFILKKRNNPPLHETDFCFEFVKRIFGDIEKYKSESLNNTKIMINNETNTFVDDYIKKLKLYPQKKIIGIHPGDNKSAYNLTLQKYIEIGKLLQKDYNVIFIFGPSEKNFVNNFSDSDKSIFYFILGDLTVKQLASFISKIDCLVSGSTGPMHIAGLMNIPTVSIFSNKPSHHWKKWHPINNNFSIVTPETQYLSLKKNSMDDINLKNCVEKVKMII